MGIRKRFYAGVTAQLLLGALCLGVFLPGGVRADMFITGIRPTDGRGKDPVAESSIYLKTVVAGFIAKPMAAGYAFEAHVIEKPKQTLYVEITLENPEDKKKPIIYRSKLDVNAPRVTVRHGPVFKLKMNSTYNVKVVLFEDAEYTKPVDVLEQKIRSHVDTRKEKTDIDRDYLPVRR